MPAMEQSDFRLARGLLIRGDPVPVDVIARLEAEGYNFMAMENTYSRFPFFNPNDTGVDTNGRQEEA